MNRIRACLLGLAALAFAGCAAHPPQVVQDEVGATGDDFCWSKWPLLQQEKTCAAPGDVALAQDACTRTALDALSHSHAANRDWIGMCMARHGLSRLPLN